MPNLEHIPPHPSPEVVERRASARYRLSALDAIREIECEERDRLVQALGEVER